MFKDHLVAWVKDYLKITYGPSQGSQTLDEIDQRSATILNQFFNHSSTSFQDYPSSPIPWPS